MEASFKKIVIICTGNICRSPIAEALLHRRLSASGARVCSAGIAALVDHPADPLAVQVASEHGYDLSAHRAQQATQTLLASMDLILTLDNTHNEWLRQRFPALYGRIHKVGRWQGNADVEDPYRKPKSAFDKAYVEIERGIDEWVARIMPSK